MRRRKNPTAPTLVHSRPYKDFMGQGTLYFLRYEGLRPVSEGGPRDRGVIGRFIGSPGRKPRPSGRG